MKAEIDRKIKLEIWKLHIAQTGLNLHFSHLEEVYSTYHFISLCVSERPILLCERYQGVNLFFGRGIFVCGSEMPSLIAKAELSCKKPSLAAQSQAL